MRFPIARHRLRQSLALTLLSSLLPVLFPATAFASPVYSFTNAGATGNAGPTQAQVTSAYTSTTLAGAVTVNTQGIQEWIVPATGNYRIKVVGAHGAPATSGNSARRGGRGAIVEGERSLTSGTKLLIIVGQGGTGTTQHGGGGGASIVALTARTASLNPSNVVIAGGGGGLRQDSSVDGGNASTETYGTTTSSYSSSSTPATSNNTTTTMNGGTATTGYGGRAGEPSCFGDGGSGWLGDGQDDSSGSTTAKALTGTAAGGIGGSANGGFGGGGSGQGCNGGGGGGGYTGGNGGYIAGGGGTYVNGLSSVTKSVDSTRSYTTSSGAIHGYVTITSLGPSVSSFSPTSTLTNSGTLNYDLVFTQSVTGLISGDFSLSGTGSSTCSIGSPSGSDATYQIQLTGCSPGSVILALRPNSIVNSSSQTGPPDTSTANTVTIDQTAPTISSVDSPSSTTYGPGTNINFTVRFSESVTVTGIPRLSLTVGSTQRYANFVSLSDSKTATFRYTVQTDASDIDTDGISVSSTLDSNSSTIADLASNQLTSFTLTPPSLTAVKVAQRAAAPTITSITGANASLSIAFTAGSDNGSAITNYEYSTNGGTLFTAFSPVDTTTPLSITGLNNGTPYSVKIRALTSLNGSSTAGESSTTVIGTPSAAPAASVVPSISGTVSVGSRLTADRGTWTNSPTSYTYRWVRSQTVDGTYAAITNATSDSYTIVSGDNSYFIKVAVTATNASGSKTETSSATTQVKVPISISGGSNISTTAGIAASSSAFTTSGGYGSINLTVSGARPEVSISSGVVTASSSLPAGSYTETITATDSLGDTASTTMSISVLSEISAPAFTVSRGTSVGSFKLTFSPVTGAASYTVKVYRSIDDFASPIATITSYVSGTDIQDGDPSSGCSGATPICFGIGTSRTFKFTITPIASSGYTSTGEGAKSSKYGMYKAYGASLTTATSGTVGLDITDSYYNYNTGKSGVIAYIYSRASNYTTVFETVSIVGTSWNRIAVPSGETYTVALKHLGATVGDTVWFDSDISPQTSGIFVFNKPNAPSDISAVRTGSGSIQVNWTAASGPYQAYYISSSTDGSNWISRGNTSSDSITVTGLTNGTAYYIKIYNFGSGTYARASDDVVMSGTITPATTPGPTASGTSSMSDSRIDITWTAPSDNGGSAITGYLIEYSATSATYNESITALASDTRLAITGLTNGLSYYVRIKALNSVGEGSAVDYAAGSAILVKGTAGSTVGVVTSITRTSATLSATINARGNTTTPTLTWGLVDGSQTDITLTAVTSDNVNVTSNISGLLPGRRYQVTSSVNPGTSQDVGGRPIYFTTNPDSVTSVSYTSTTSALTVSWTAMASGNGYGFSYDVTLSLNGNAVGSGCSNITASSGGRSSCTLSGLTANTTYSVSITASITGGDYGNGASEAYILSAATDPNVATITLNVNSGNHTIARGSTINIVATTNVAGAVTFKANGREIKECKQKATSSLQATCSWRPSTHGTVTFTAFFNPTSNQYTNVTSAKTSVLMTRRTSRS